MNELLSRVATRTMLSLTLCLGACGGGGYAGPGPGTCGPQTCSGCCLGDVCQPGSTSESCGTGGGQCVQCQGYQACLPDQSCGLLPSQSWLLAALSAAIAPTNNGASWDADGSPPDPYVLFDDVNRTSVQQDTYSPSWGTGFVYTAQQLQAGVRVQVFDKDLVSDDPISAARTLQVTEADFAAGSLTIRNWDGVQTISFGLEKR